MGLHVVPKGLRAAKAALYFFKDYPIRAFVYIDSRNFHYQLEERGIDSYSFDYRALATFLADRKQLCAVKFYCAKYPAAIDQIKHNRDDALFAHLIAQQNITVKSGKYKFEISNPKGTLREKGVDVLLATDVLFDGFMNAYECAYIVSDDSDIIPAIEKLHEYAPSIPIYQATFSPKQDWKRVCKNIIQLYPNKIKKMQIKVMPTKETLSDLASKFNNK